MTDNTVTKLTRQQVWLFFFIIAVALSNLFSIDLYLPSLPAIEKSLHVTQAIAQYTVSFYILALAISGLVFGSLSDKLGRKILIIFGLLFTIFGSVLCYISPTEHALLLGRIIQGIGAGGSIVAVRAMISDTVSGKTLAIVGSYFSSLIALSPVVAPIVGGYIQHYYDWRADFIVLGVYTFVILLIAFFVPETNQNKAAHSFKIGYHLKNYFYLLTRADYITFTFCGGLSIAVSMAYATSAPFILQNTLHLTPITFGWMGIFVGGANILAKLIGPSLIKRFNMYVVFSWGLFSIVLAGIILLTTHLFFILTVPIVMLAVFITLFGQGLASANAVALSVSPYRHMGGAANALWTFIQMGLSFVVSYYLSLPLFESDQVTGLSSAYLLIGALSLAAFFIYRATHRVQSAA